MEIHKRYIKENIDKYADMLVSMLSYRLADVESYRELDNIERAIITEDLFDKIKIEY